MTSALKHGDWDEAGNCRLCGEAGRCPAAAPQSRDPRATFTEALAADPFSGNPLRWMLEVSEARDSNPRARTVTLKFSRATLLMWQDRARSTLEGVAQ